MCEEWDSGVRCGCSMCVECDDIFFHGLLCGDCVLALSLLTVIGTKVELEGRTGDGVVSMECWLGWLVVDAVVIFVIT